MNFDDEIISKDFLELSNRQRLKILSNLYEKKFKLTDLAKKLDATIPEVFRNCERLQKTDFIIKGVDGFYQLTPYGSAFLSMFPSFAFLSENKAYFRKHNFGGLPQKFIRTVGALKNNQHIRGVSNVIECWKEIFTNSEGYIFGILVEEPLDLLEPIAKKAKKGIKIKSIFSESAIIPDARKQRVDELGFETLVKKGLVERRIRKDTDVVVVLNEKEACVLFPSIKGKTDITEMFYSADMLFHEWCLDYFWFSWNNAEIFQESKFKTE